SLTLSTAWRGKSFIGSPCSSHFPLDGENDETGVAPGERTRRGGAKELLRWRGLFSRSDRPRSDASEKLERPWPRPGPQARARPLGASPPSEKSSRSRADAIPRSEARPRRLRLPRASGLDQPSLPKAAPSRAIPFPML